MSRLPIVPSLDLAGRRGVPAALTTGFERGRAPADPA